MDLKKRLENKNIEFTKKENLIGEENIPQIENELGVKIGEQLKQYLLDIGYLTYKHIEFCGINKKTMLNSMMIKETKWLHDKEEIFGKYIVMIDFDGHDLYIVDSKDRIFHLIYEGDIVLFEYTKKQLNDFIESYINEVDNYLNNYNS